MMEEESLLFQNVLWHLHMSNSVHWYTDKQTNKHIYIHIVNK